MRSLNFDNNKKLLYLVATPIGNLDEMTPRAIKILAEMDLIACEDTRNTAKLLSFFNLSKPLVSLREHNETEQSEKLILDIQNGKKVAYVSDAGYPCISDPGARLVKKCIENNINVSAISGPNAALNALVASGLSCDHFYFHGFLDARTNARLEELRNLATRKETLIFYESPHRIQKTLNDMFAILGNRSACICRELTKKHEEYIRDTLENLCQIDPETLKGEMVIVVEGTLGEIKPSVNNDEIIKMIKNLVESGVSTKDAIKRVSEITSVSKNYIYKIYHIN